MNNIKFGFLQYASRLKYLFALLIGVWLLSLIIHFSRPNGGGSRLVTPVPLDMLQVAYNSTIAKTVEYCNPAASIVASEEGKSPVRRGKLKFVAVVTRHGDRSPLRIIRNQMDIDCTPERNVLFERFIQTAYTMSPKHSFNSLSVFPKDYRCSEAGMLTWAGINQQLILGNKLRKVYSGRLFKIWSPSSVSVFSTGFPRTYHSAVAFLYGFFQTPNISDIKVSPAKNYKFCFLDDFCYCDLIEVYEYLMYNRWRRLWKSQPMIVSLLQRLSPILKYHPDQNNAEEPFEVFDSLMGYVCHHHPLPCIPGTNTCVTYHDVYEVVNYMHWHRREIKTIMGSYFLRKYGLLNMQGFLNHLLEKMQDSTRGLELTKFALFSGHDLTIEGLLDTFGIEEVLIVPYASRIIFEIYSFWKEDEEYAIKIIYNGRDISSKVVFCSKYFTPEFKKTNPSEYGVCLFTYFEKFVETALHELGDTSFQEACNPTF